MQNLEDKVKIKSGDASRILEDYKQRISQVIEEEREAIKLEAKNEAKAIVTKALDEANDIQNQAKKEAVNFVNEAQKAIADLVTPMALEHYQKKNARSLTKSEFDELEYLKLCILTGMKPYMEIDADVIKSIIDASTKPSKEFTEAIESAVASFVDTQNRKPSIDEMRYIYASTFASYS